MVIFCLWQSLAAQTSNSAIIGKYYWNGSIAKNKPWFSIGFGYSIFSIEKEAVSSTVEQP